MGRKPTSTNPRNIRRMSRYWQLRNAGLTVKECEKAATHPTRYAEAMTARGLTPDPELSRRRYAGKPRIDTPRSRLFFELYHDLRARGANAMFASEYGRNRDKHTKGVRILNGEESE